MPRVLLVEDHDHLHRILCDVILQAGYQADCVKTKEEALGFLGPGSHSLVIADVVLPDGSGREVAARARELNIQSVLMTGHPDEIRSLALTTIVHLSKPFSIDEFEQVLRDNVR